VVFIHPKEKNLPHTNGVWYLLLNLNILRLANPTPTQNKKKIYIPQTHPTRLQCYPDPSAIQEKEKKHSKAIDEIVQTRQLKLDKLGKLQPPNVATLSAHACFMTIPAASSNYR